MPTPTDMPPTQNPGPIYLVFAVICVALMVGLGFLRYRVGGAPGWVDFGELVVLALLLLAFVRPEKFDDALKTVASKLPVFKFTRDGNGKGNGP